jgi:hypothetical protein
MSKYTVYQIMITRNTGLKANTAAQNILYEVFQTFSPWDAKKKNICNKVYL